MRVDIGRMIDESMVALDGDLEAAIVRAESVIELDEDREYPIGTSNDSNHSRLYYNDGWMIEPANGSSLLVNHLWSPEPALFVEQGWSIDQIVDRTLIHAQHNGRDFTSIQRRLAEPISLTGNAAIAFQPWLFPGEEKLNRHNLADAWDSIPSTNIMFVNGIGSAIYPAGILTDDRSKRYVITLSNIIDLVLEDTRENRLYGCETLSPVDWQKFKKEFRGILIPIFEANPHYRAMQDIVDPIPEPSGEQPALDELYGFLTIAGTMMYENRHDGVSIEDFHEYTTNALKFCLQEHQRFEQAYRDEHPIISRFKRQEQEVSKRLQVLKHLADNTGLLVSTYFRTWHVMTRHPSYAAVLREKHHEISMRENSALGFSIDVDISDDIYERVPGYRLMDYLGRGAFKQAYLGQNVETEKLKAVKFLDMNELGRFLQERLGWDEEEVKKREYRAEDLKELRNPHIARIDDIIVDAQGNPVIVEELFEETLEDRLMRGKLSAYETLEIAYQIADALEATTSLDIPITHGDLKPANVGLIGNLVKLFDFGLANSVHAEEVAANRLVVGSVPSRAPELYEEGLPSAQSDMYGLGIIIGKMRTGEYIFGYKRVNEDERFDYEREVHGNIRKILGNEEETATMYKRLELEEPVERVMRALLQLNPESRPENFTKVKEIIQEAQHDLIELEASITLSTKEYSARE